MVLRVMTTVDEDGVENMKPREEVKRDGDHDSGPHKRWRR
jgi:hypothetical protein